MSNTATFISILLGIITISSLVIAGVFQLVKIVLNVQSSLEQLKNNILKGDESLNYRITYLESRLTNLEERQETMANKLRDLISIIKAHHPESFRRSDD